MNHFSILYHKIIIILVFTLFCNSSQAQNKEDIAVKEVILDLFEGMKEGDSARVSKLFSKKVRMMTSFESSEGEPLLKEGSLENFLRAIGTPHPEVWNEIIWNTEIKIDDNLAQVWTNYAFYVDETFSHCGVDAFQLVKNEQGSWKIIHLIDTRRKNPCQTK